MEAFAYLFYFILFCIGSRFIYKSYLPFKANWEARKWDKVKGEIVELKVNQKWQSLNDSIEDNNQFELGYEYEYKGELYRNSQLDLESKKVHSFNNSKELGLHMYDLNLFLDDVRKYPEIIVWVEPNNPTMTIIRNLWPRYLTNMIMGTTLMIWGICTTRLFMNAESDIGGIKLEDKIEIVEFLPKETIKELKAIENAKREAMYREHSEKNRKWREERGLLVD